MSEEIKNVEENKTEELKDLKPIVIRIAKTGEVFTLEFDRETVKWAEDRGFTANPANGYAPLYEKPMSGFEDLFYYAFHMHHKTVSKAYSDHILHDVLHGFKDGMIDRLIGLHAKTYDTLMQSEDDAKNEEVVVEM